MLKNGKKLLFAVCGSLLFITMAFVLAASPPIISGILIKPIPANHTDTLNCSANYNDTDSDKGNVTFSWYNGSTLYWQVTQFNKMSGETVQEPLTWTSTNGLVGYWKFSEGNGTFAYDLSTSRYTGNLTNNSLGIGQTGTCFANGACPAWDTGKYGSGLTFDGKNDFVDIGDYDRLTNFKFTTGNWTVFSWVKVNSLPAANRFIFGLRTGSDKDFQMGINSANKAYIEWVAYPEHPAYSRTVGANSLADGNWHWVAAQRYNKTRIMLYVDGVLEGTDDTVNSYSITLAQWFSRWSIGAKFDGCCDVEATGDWQAFFNGTIDEVQVYNVALSSAEVNESYMNSPHFRGETWNCTINATDSTGLSGTPISSIATISPCEDTTAKICNVDCSKNYNIQTPIDLGSNYLFITGSGTFTSNSNMKNQGMTFISGGCDVRNL